MSLGLTYCKLKQYDKAATNFSYAIELNPNNEITYLSLALAYCKLEQYNKAIENISKAIGLNQYDNVKGYSQIIKCYLNIMEVCIIAGKPDQFSHWLNRLETNIPENKLSKGNLIIKLYLLLVNKYVINDSTSSIEKQLDILLKDKSNIKLSWSFDLIDEWLKNPKNGLTQKQIKYIRDLTAEVKGVFDATTERCNNGACNNGAQQRSHTLTNDRNNGAIH